jgi:hypothetical protein
MLWQSRKGTHLKVDMHGHMNSRETKEGIRDTWDITMDTQRVERSREQSSMWRFTFSLLLSHAAPVPLFTTLSWFSCHHATGTWSCSATRSLEPSILVSPLLQGPFAHIFTCINANQTATCTCNTRSTISTHHVINHSSLRSDHPPKGS